MTNIQVSFVFISVEYSIVWLIHNLFIMQLLLDIELFSVFCYYKQYY